MRARAIKVTAVYFIVAVMQFVLIAHNAIGETTKERVKKELTINKLIDVELRERNLHQSLNYVGKLLRTQRNTGYAFMILGNADVDLGEIDIIVNEITIADLLNRIADRTNYTYEVDEFAIIWRPK